MSKYKADILKPFGPRILKVVLPEEVLGKLIDITDKLIADDKRENYGCTLAGQIKEEVKIPKEILKKEKLDQIFDMYLRTYVLHCLDELNSFTEETHDILCSTLSMWFNEMQPGGEYNPVHFHTNCFVSSTLYLKVPKIKKKIKGKDNEHCKIDRDGVIEFIDRSVAPNFLYKGTLDIHPQEGEMYIWPSSLLHTVYPFFGNEVRRSIAWNGTYRVVDKKTKLIVAGLTKNNWIKWKQLTTT